jgi:hypothetical protein
MKKSLTVSRNICVLAFAAYCIWGWVTPATAQSVTWQILPFPQSTWLGSHGQTATTNGNVVTLRGQPVRTVQTFSGPLSISYDVVLSSRPTDPGADGALEFFFVPLGVSSNQVAPNISFQMVFRNYGSDTLLFQTNNGAAAFNISEIPFSITTQTVYHVGINVSGSGGLSWVVNNVTNPIPGTIKEPFSQYQLEIEGWQPTDVWQVSNFTAVPEPSAMALVTTGLMGMLLYRSKRTR